MDQQEKRDKMHDYADTKVVSIFVSRNSELMGYNI